MKKAIRYNVSEYMLKPVTAMELTKSAPEYERKAGFQKKKRTEKKWNPCRRLQRIITRMWMSSGRESTGDSCKLYKEMYR